MNKLIIIGCPYTAMSNIDMAFEDIEPKDITIVNCNDVVSIDSHSVFLNNGNSLDINTFDSSFIRYPYDLIPPHSKTFELREEIEFYKTLSLALDSVAINHLASTWMLRNRAFSLKQAHSFGINIAEYIVLKNKNELPISKDQAIKALGNCFVSSDTEDLSSNIKEFVHIEEDDGDFAAIFPASLLNDKSIKRYLSTVGVAFLQQPINAANEYRGYIVGYTPFIYVREKINAFDKSTAKYHTTPYNLTNRTMSGLKKLMNRFNMKYLCFDFMSDKNCNEIIIDINPYGSMPKYSEHSEPSLQLAKLLMGMTS